MVGLNQIPSHLTVKKESCFIVPPISVSCLMHAARFAWAVVLVGPFWVKSAHNLAVNASLFQQRTNRAI